MEQGAIFNIPVPDDPLDKYQDIKDQAGVVIKSAEDQLTYRDKKEFDKEIGEHVSRKQKLQSNMEIAYSVVWGQCSTRLQKKLEGHE